MNAIAYDVIKNGELIFRSIYSPISVQYAKNNDCDEVWKYNIKLFEPIKLIWKKGEQNE